VQLIIPSNNPILARICLQSIEENDPGFLASIIIVTSDAEEFAPVLDEFPDVTLLALTDEPFNFAAWNNAALRHAPDDDSYLLLNDDTELLTRGGLTMLEKLVENPASPHIISAAIRGTGGVIDQRQATMNSVRLMAGHVAFTAVAIRREAFDRLGLLDERFVGYGYEDNDFCQRALAEGMSIATFDGCVIAHRKPHSTFGRRGDFRDLWLLNETLYFEKWGEPQDVVVVVGGSRSGGAVLSAVLDEMGFDMPDKPMLFERNVSAYYRDDVLAKAARRGDVGIRNYIGNRNFRTGGKWGTRLWPQPEAAIRFLSALKDSSKSLTIIFADRSRQARLNSYVMHGGVKMQEAMERIDAEMEGERRLQQWARDNGIPHHMADYDSLVLDTYGALEVIAGVVGWAGTMTTARARVEPRFRTFDMYGKLVKSIPRTDFGKVAVGVRLTHPEAAFVGCYARLLRDGLRDGDVILTPTIRTPSHWAASTLMRRFLASDADTLLLIDDDMTFPPDLLKKLRSNEDNFRYGIVSALATQRVPPPRALVMRLSEQQPPLPDALNGIYYDLLVDEVRPGETMPVDATGFAFTLIRREVIEAMTDAEWGAPFTQYVQWGSGGEGEDVNFCRRAGSLGYQTAVDAGCHVGHVGSVVYGYEEFDQWRNQQSGTGLSANRLAELLESALAFMPDAERQEALTLLQKAREP
jgi:GT2 family glycosyltransferase